MTTGFDWGSVGNASAFLSAFGETLKVVGGGTVQAIFEDGYNDDRSALDIRVRYRLIFPNYEREALKVDSPNASDPVVECRGRRYKLRSIHPYDLPGWSQAALIDVGGCD